MPVTIPAAMLRGNCPPPLPCKHLAKRDGNKSRAITQLIATYPCPVAVRPRFFRLRIGMFLKDVPGFGDAPVTPEVPYRHNYLAFESRGSP